MPTQTISIGEVEVYLTVSEIDGRAVVQVDGTGSIRIYLNDGVIWNGDPDDHDHLACDCVLEWERSNT